MKESFLFLARSKYIACLAIIVIGYGVAINLVEVTWKGQLKLQYPNPNDYQAFMGYFSTITGTATILMMLFVGGNVIRRFGVGKLGAALITPVVLLITGDWASSARYFQRFVNCYDRYARHNTADASCYFRYGSKYHEQICEVLLIRSDQRDGLHPLTDQESGR